MQFGVIASKYSKRHALEKKVIYRKRALGFNRLTKTNQWKSKDMMETMRKCGQPVN